MSGLSPRFQVAGLVQQVARESNRYGFFGGVLFLFYFPMKVAKDNIHSSWGKLKLRLKLCDSNT